jgi:hypothetical protein
MLHTPNVKTTISRVVARLSNFVTPVSLSAHYRLYSCHDSNLKWGLPFNGPSREKIMHNIRQEAPGLAIALVRMRKIASRIDGYHGSDWRPVFLALAAHCH